MPSRSAPTTRKSSTPTVLLEGRDGDKAYGLTGQYDLGGGATVNGGIASSMASAASTTATSAIVGDFGISMAF